MIVLWDVWILIQELQNTSNVRKLTNCDDNYWERSHLKIFVILNIHVISLISIPKNVIYK